MSEIPMIANKSSRIISCLLPVLVVVALSSLTHAQQIPITPPAADTASTSAVATESALPASQIIELLQEKPELMVDLKRLAAEQLQTQGMNVQEDSITDE